MEIRPLDAPPLAGAAFARAESALALAGLIGSIGDAAFGQRGIEHLNRLLPIGWWAVYRLFDDAPPRLLAGGHLDAADCIADSFAAYRGGLYREDEAFGLSRERVRAGATPVMTYLHARELRRAHRQRIYTRHGLSERLSVLGPDRDGALLAVNLYRRVDQPMVSDDERDRFHALGALLLACVARHVALADAARPAVLAALPRRESEVCERLLRGWTHDGVAADLGISPTTVKTYRDRAFERLGIHHRHQLFALALDEVAQSTPRRTDAAGDRR
jgi:DNA-binding CsgD family transcriptional regulator